MMWFQGLIVGLSHIPAKKRFTMKAALEKIAQFFKKEWFLVVMILFISIIILVFEMFVS